MTDYTDEKEVHDAFLSWSDRVSDAVGLYKRIEIAPLWAQYKVFTAMLKAINEAPNTEGQRRTAHGHTPLEPGKTGLSEARADLEILVKDREALIVYAISLMSGKVSA